jgi:hypothetical protein
MMHQPAYFMQYIEIWQIDMKSCCLNFNGPRVLRPGGRLPPNSAFKRGSHGKKSKVLLPSAAAGSGRMWQGKIKSLDVASLLSLL